MNKLRLSFLKSLGGKVAIGDFINPPKEIADCSFNLVDDTDVHVINLSTKKDKELFIESFAPRANTGEQPMPDGFPMLVDISGSTYKEMACEVYWGDNDSGESSKVKSWMPDIDALIDLQNKHDRIMPPVCGKAFFKAVSDGIAQSNEDIKAMQQKLRESLDEESIPTFSTALNKDRAAFTGPKSSISHSYTASNGSMGVLTDPNGIEVVSDPATIAECFERDRAADDSSLPGLPEEWLNGKLKSERITSYKKPTEKHEDEIEQLESVVSALRNAGFFVQMDALLFMQQTGLINGLTNKGE